MIKLVVLLLGAVSVYPTEEAPTKVSTPTSVRLLKLNGDFVIDFGQYSEDYVVSGPQVAQRGYTTAVVGKYGATVWNPDCSSSILTDTRQFAMIRDKLATLDPGKLNPDDEWMSVRYSLETGEKESYRYKNIRSEFGDNYQEGGAKKYHNSDDIPGDSFLNYQPQASPDKRIFFNEFKYHDTPKMIFSTVDKDGILKTGDVFCLKQGYEANLTDEEESNDEV